MAHSGTTGFITERKISKTEPLATHKKLAEIIEFLPDAIFAINRQGEVTAWNKAIEQMTGVPKEAMIGRDNYAYAVPFYGEPRPMLVDLVMNPGTEWLDKYETMEWRGNKVYAEVPVCNLRGGEGSYVWGTASTMFDKKGEAIGAIETIRDIDDLRHLESSLRTREKELVEKASQLEEMNTALKVLLKRREEDQKELQEAVISNVKGMILPYIDRLAQSGLDEKQMAYLDILESCLKKIISPFLKNLSSKFHNLTPMEIDVAGLIKEGKTSKEIANALCLSEKTILAHRYNLRTKLGLRSEKVNLRSYLSFLE